MGWKRGSTVNTVSKHVKLRPEDIEFVLKYAEEHGLDFSSALRDIINKVRKLTEQGKVII